MNNHIKGIYFFISFFCHIAIVISFLIFSRDATFQKSFIVLGVHSQKPSKAFYKSTHYTPSATVKRSGKKTQATAVKKSSSVRGKQPVIPVVKKVKAKVSKPARSVDVQEQDEQEPLAKKTTMIEEKKSSKKKSARKKKKAKKKAVQKEKKVKQKKRKQAFDKVEPKAKKLFKKPQPEVRQPEAMPEEEKKELVESLDHTKTATVYLNQAVAEAELDPDETLEFSMGELSDVRLRGYYEHIQREVTRLWRPPVGVPQGTECTLSFSISKDGKVEKFDIIKRSKMLIYDLSILRVAQHFSFDQCLWGKKFTIDFRQ